MWIFSFLTVPNFFVTMGAHTFLETFRLDFWTSSTHIFVGFEIPNIIILFSTALTKLVFELFMNNTDMLI